MKKMTRVIVTFLTILILASCTIEQKPSSDIITPAEKFQLWNGIDFTGWKLYIPDETVDVNSVWTIVDGVIHCTGIPSGYIRTEKNYTNYKLSLEWRWPAEPGNSGVLLHMSEPDKIWPKSIEAQLKSGNAGDFWLIDGTEINEHVDKSSRRVARPNESSEKPPGEWNTYEIACSENIIRVRINGIEQNVSTGTSVQMGKICLQSEGKPVQFRNIYLEPVQ